MREERFQLITSITKVCFFVAVLANSWKILEVKGVIIKCPVFFSELLFDNLLSHWTLSLFMNTTDSFVSDSTKPSFHLKSLHAFNLLERN